MFKSAAFAAMALLFSGPAHATIIEFSGGEDDYVVKGYLEYDPFRAATSVFQNDGSTYYDFDGGSMYVSLNGQPYRTGTLSLGATVQRPGFINEFAFYSTITALLTWAGPITEDEPFGSEYFSFFVLFPEFTVVQDGRIIANLPNGPIAPSGYSAFGELAYNPEKDEGRNTSLDFNFVSPVPEPSAWGCMLLGFLATGLLVRQRKARHDPAHRLTAA